MLIFQDNLLQFGNFAKDLSLDEQMIPYYGQLCVLQLDILSNLRCIWEKMRRQKVH